MHKTTEALCLFIKHLYASFRETAADSPFELVSVEMVPDFQIEEEDNSGFSSDCISDGELTCRLFMIGE